MSPFFLWVRASPNGLPGIDVYDGAVARRATNARPLRTATSGAILTGIGREL
jgi:hypothetical protein